METKETHNTKTILLSISSPILVRNFLAIPGGVYDILKTEKDVRIVIVTPRGAYEHIKKDFGAGAEVVPIDVSWNRKGIERLYAFVATYLNFTEGARLFARLGVRIDVPTAGGMNYTYPIKLFIACTLGKSWWVRNRLMPRLDTLVFRKRPYKNIFDEYRPDVVFLPDWHCTQDTPLLREAKRQGVKTVGMVASWDHLPKKFEPLKLDTILVWSEEFKREAMELQDYEEKNVVVTGVPQYDVFMRCELLMSRDSFCTTYGIDPKKKILFFISESKYSPDDGDVVDILLSSAREKKLNANAHVFIRPYPGVDYDRQKFEKFVNEDGVYIDWIETRKLFGHSGHSWYPTFSDIVHFFNCLYHADVVINTYSSVSVESAVLLKPVININFDGRKKRPFGESIKRFKHLQHFNRVLESGAVVQVENENELLSAVNRLLDDPNVNRRNSEALREKMCWKTDGRTGERIANVILDSIRCM